MKEPSPQRPLAQPDEINAGSNYSRAILVTAVGFVGMIGLVAIGVYSTSDLPRSQKNMLLKEGGIVESASVWLYVITGLALLAIGIQQWIRQRSLEQNGSVATTRLGPMHPWLLAGIVFCFAARELDLNKRLNGLSVMKIRYFTSSEVGLFEKLVVFVILATIALVVIRVFVIYHRKIIFRFKNGHLAGVLPVLAVLLIAFSKGLDSGVGSLSRNGVLQLEAWQKQGVAAAEEMSEFLIPVLFLSMLIITIVPQFHGPKSDAAVENKDDSQRLDDFKKAA